MGVSCAGLGLPFFLAEALVAEDIGVAGVGSYGFETEAGSGVRVAGAGSDAGSGIESGSESFVGEAVADLVSPAFGGFLFSGSLLSSLPQFWDDRWFCTGPDPNLFLSSPWLAAH